jgi:hypothetical protein
MTLQELIGMISGINPLMMLAIILSPPMLAILFGFFQSKEQPAKSPLKYLYALLVYAVCIPGIFAGVLTAYSLFFLRKNLLQLDVFVYFLPILCMIVTLGLISRRVCWDQIPGVDRIYAMMIVLILSFSIALAIQKTNIFIFFGGSLATLGMIALCCFILLRKSLSVLVGTEKKDFE